MNVPRFPNLGRSDFNFKTSQNFQFWYIWISIQMSPFRSTVPLPTTRVSIYHTKTWFFPLINIISFILFTQKQFQLDRPMLSYILTHHMFVHTPKNMPMTKSYKFKEQVRHGILPKTRTTWTLSMSLRLTLNFHVNFMREIIICHWLIFIWPTHMINLYIFFVHYKQKHTTWRVHRRIIKKFLAKSSFIFTWNVNEKWERKENL